VLQDALNVLKKHFGYSVFKNGQEKVISSILEGRDTVAIMPTGGGKSACYQIPALLLPGVTLVISPLISLMKDQVDALTGIGIPSSFINSSLSQKQLRDTIQLASNGKYKLIYIAPERLESESFLEMLKNIPISLVAVDEAHCVSQWGHDFRPSYRSISNLIGELDNRPIIAAFTATATDQVRHDLIKLLDLESPNVFITGFDRENLFFSVEKGVKKSNFLIDYIESHKNQTGIIYTSTRKEADAVCDFLIKKGYSAGRYHAGMGDDERKDSQEAFIYDRVQIIVATNAFGMGIDKSNVRFVIHFNMPKNIESYYQEAGRAGRDDEPSDCIMLYSAGDVHIQKFLIEQNLLSNERKQNEHSKLQSIIDYCHTSGCLRKYILEYFGDSYKADNCNNCNNCTDTTEHSDITIEAQKIFSCIKRMGEQYGASLVANVLRGSSTKKVHQLGFNNLPTYGIMKEYTISDIVSMISLLSAEDYISVSGGQYPTLKLQKRAFSVLKGEERVEQRMAKKSAPDKEDSCLFDMLRALRRDIAEEEGIPPYLIFHDSTLKEMSKFLPTDKIKMLDIAGVGESKLFKYGDRFVAAIIKWMSENNLSEPSSSPRTIKPLKASAEKIPSNLITHDMYLSGKSLEAIARERELSLITIKNHIEKSFLDGLNVDWDTFIPKEHEELILKTINEIGAAKLKPLKDALPNEVDYFAIKAVICKHIKGVIE
jgi:ATP-dependent DNA helicase RecQ